MKRRIAQIALVVTDRARSTAFYADVFGMEHVFDTAEFRGPDADRVQNMDRVASSTSWLIDDRETFQLEIFEFENPRSRPLPAGHGIADEGYNRVIIAVKSLEQTTNAAVAAGASLQVIFGSTRLGHPPHAVLRDPDGILLELVEAPELVPATLPARIVGLGMTSRDLAKTVEDMCDGFGFSTCEDRFQHAVFWQEGGRLEAVRTMRLDDMYLVVSQYRDSRPRPPDHRLADIGLMNFAIGFPDAGDFDACYDRTCAMGMCSNAEPMVIPGKASVTYHNDRQGFSVEMIYLSPKLHGLYGFARPGALDRLMNRYLNWRSRRVYRRHLAAPHSQPEQK